MPRTGLWLRVFVALLLAVLPPLLLLVGALLLTETILRDTEPDLVAIVVVAGSIVWAAVLGIVYARGLGDDVRSLLTLAERGDAGTDPEIGDAYRQMASSLDERNRQVAALAREANLVPIDDAPRQVVAAVVSAVRSVMRDETWRCAVLASESEDILPPGIYHGTDESRDVEPIGELERWAAVSAADVPAGRVEGPWGAFAVIDVAVSDRMRAILYAPWEGRVKPTPAEVDLLTLVGQHAGTALEHSLLYARVRSQADELNRLAAVQADFLRGVTHDLQTPLTSIGALATELRADESVPDRARADLESITHQAERLRRMVGQLLVASRLEAGVLTAQQEVFAVPPLVERTWAALRADRPFELVVEGAPHLAVADPDRLEQVLWALLDNAVKYSPDGSAIGVHIEPDGEELAITVRDSGIGMDEATRERAFEQFYRSRDARRMVPDGSGVGLYAASGLMAAMGGSLGIDTELGRGSAFTMRVPAEPSANGE
ncbi:MAG TPA: HAMP domain-containing sensor histidine kinase [Candidatus Limnocylindrales bacterium]|nr:HAMP domain-containing sensor histidine kinase [Candidatus Limnocylindrales bacterium]